MRALKNKQINKQNQNKEENEQKQILNTLLPPLIHLRSNIYWTSRINLLWKIDEVFLYDILCFYLGLMHSATPRDIMKFYLIGNEEFEQRIRENSEKVRFLILLYIL